MKKKTRSILEELNTIGVKTKNNDLLVENTACNLIESSINLINMISQNYDEQTASELERKFLASIKSGDPRKFKRSITRIIEARDGE